jgi:simple sugar transport system permease protein/D-xylose transport system permease protein
MTDTSVVAADLQDERLTHRTGVMGVLADTWDRVRGGDVGALPVVIGLFVIWGIFEAVNQNFLSPLNLSNLLMQMTSTGVISLGIVLVLLLGEIDLSVGSVSGLGSAIIGVLAAKQGLPQPVAILVAIAAGVVVGLLYSVVFNRFGVPSFIITMAGLLAFQGLMLLLLGKDGSINLGTFDTSFIVWWGQAAYVPSWLAYVFAVVAAAAYTLLRLYGHRRRRVAGLSARPVWLTVTNGVALAVILSAIVWYLYLPMGRQRSRGIGWMFVFFVALVLILHYALKRTKWGRSIYAVGGNKEAARRAGINVTMIVTSVFVICSALAAVGGMLAAGRLGTSTTSAGTADVNLNAIAAAVIGGTSLFGGRGTAWSAVLGIVVIQSISSGLDLLSLNSSWKFIITGIVLLVAVILDATTRRSRERHGRA